MNKIRRFIETSGVYLIGSVLSRLISFILLPLYTNKLSPDKFGTYDLVVTIIGFFAPIAFFQIWDGMFRFAFDKKELDEKHSIISNSFIVWIFGLILYSMSFGIASKIMRIEYEGLIFIYGLSTALQYQYTFIARAFLKNKLFVITGLVNSLLSAVINVILILKFNMGIQSLYIAPVIGSVVQALMIEMTLHPLKKFRISDVNTKLQIQMVKFSLPLCVATISYWLLSGYTKVAISNQLGTYANGLYAVAGKFTSLITLVITVFQYAWNEMAYLMANDDNRTAKYKRSVEYILKVVIMSSAIFMILIKIIFPYFIDSAYFAALAVVPLSLIGVAANAFAGFIGTIFMTEKQTKWIFWTTVISAAINIISLWIFTPIWGLQGAIGSLCLAFTVLAFIRMYAIGRVFTIVLPKSNFIYFIILAATVCVFYAINNVILLLFIIIILSGILFYSLRNILIPLWNGFIRKRG